jgi:hypothetical protein
VNDYLVVFWMYVFFHSYSLPKKPILTISAAFATEISRNYTAFCRLDSDKFIFIIGRNGIVVRLFFR